MSTIDPREEALDRVKTSAHRLKLAETVTKTARTELYRSVLHAADSGCATMAVAAAAGWRTKKAVYDACRSVRVVSS